MRKLLATLAIAGLFAMPAQADDTAIKHLSGRTLDVVATFDNSGTGARLWAVISDTLKARIPNFQVRIRYNDVGSGVSAVNDLFADTRGSLSIVFALIPEIAFAQTEGVEGVAFDLGKAQWLAGLQREGQVMAVRKGLSLDIETLRASGQRLLVPVDTINGNGAIIHTLLNAATGLRGQLVVGFNSAESLRALVVGDVDMRRQQLSPEVNALLESGEMVSLYTISGSGFPDTVDASRTLESVALPDAPRAILDYVSSMSSLGRAFLAAPTANTEDVSALRTIFAEILSDPVVLEEIASQFAKVTLVPVDEVNRMMDDLLLLDPADKAAVDFAFECGMAMSRGTLDRCDFSTLGSAN